MHVMPIMKYNPSITPGNGSAWNVRNGIGYFFRPGEFPEFSISKCLDLSHMPSEYWAKSAVTCIWAFQLGIFHYIRDSVLCIAWMSGWAQNIFFNILSSTSVTNTEIIPVFNSHRNWLLNQSYLVQLHLRCDSSCNISCNIWCNISEKHARNLTEHHHLYQALALITIINYSVLKVNKRHH